jgi:hypothetical protein
MLPKSVSPKVVPFLAMPVFFLLLIPLFPLQRALLNFLDVREDGAGGNLFLLALFPSVYLARKGLAFLGIQVRSRSVERFQAVERDDEAEGAVELPIRVIRGEREIRVLSAASYLAGAVCFVLAWFLPAAAWETHWMKTVAMLGLSTFLLILGFLIARGKPDFICELTEEGISAPDGRFWVRQTFVPWGDLVRCEIIRDDETWWCDHFLLWDRGGRQRFKRSREWMGRVRRSERTRIFRALRARFPLKAKPDKGSKPAMAGVASTAVWDRDLDG